MEGGGVRVGMGKDGKEDRDGGLGGGRKIEGWSGEFAIKPLTRQALTKPPSPLSTKIPPTN